MCRRHRSEARAVAQRYVVPPAVQRPSVEHQSTANSCLVPRLPVLQRGEEPSRRFSCTSARQHSTVREDPASRLASVTSLGTSRFCRRSGAKDAHFLAATDVRMGLRFALRTGTCLHEHDLRATFIATKPLSNWMGHGQSPMSLHQGWARRSPMQARHPQAPRPYGRGVPTSGKNHSHAAQELRPLRTARSTWPRAPPWARVLLTRLAIEAIHTAVIIEHTRRWASITERSAGHWRGRPLGLEERDVRPERYRAASSARRAG